MDYQDFTELSPEFEQFYNEAASYQIDSPEIISPSFVELSEISQKYEFGEQLGQGGMKKIVRVYDHLARRYVAMALLPDDAEQTVYDPFIHEAWLTSQLDHPNIIKIHDVGLDENQRPFFTMDLKTGSSLKTFLQTHANTVSLDQLLEIFLKLCDAIAYAHSKNILHLDLKPENIQIGSFGEVMVCDWGLGRLISLDDGSDIDKLLLNSELRDTNLRHEKMTIGTPGFMAVEQLKRSNALSEKSDIYGLGSLLQYMLQVNPDFVGKSLSAVIKKATSEQPEDRYNSVEVLGEEVKKFRLGYATNAEQAGLSEELKLFYRRNRAVCLITALSLIVIILGTALFVVKIDQSRRAADENYQIAEKERQKAEYSLNLYHQEKASFANLMDNYSRSIYTDDLQLVSKEFYQTPVKIAREALERIEIILRHDPNDRKALKQKMYILFCIQRYAEAAKITTFKEGTHLAFLSKINAEMNLTSYKKVTIDLLIEIIEQFDPRPNRIPFISKIIACDYAMRYKKNNKKVASSYYRVVQKAVSYYNPKWDDENFIYNETSKTLKLSGHDLKHLSSLWEGDQCFLRFIPIKNLHITHCDFYNLYELEGLKQLTKLDIQGTQVTDLRPLEKFKKLKILTISEGQFTQKQLSVLPERIAVRVAE
jgi:serine/threonine protein kinase